MGFATPDVVCMGVEWKAQVRETSKRPHFKFLSLLVWGFEFGGFKLLRSKLFVVAALCYPGPWLRLMGCFFLVSAPVWGRTEHGSTGLGLLGFTFLPHLLALPPGWIEHSPGHILHSFPLSCCPIPLPGSGIPCTLRLCHIFLGAPSVSYLGLVKWGYFRLEPL